MGSKNGEKLVYFVRHGESVGNAANVFQGHEGGLSPEGERQARVLAERFSRIPIEVIFSSTMSRAHQTAKIIHRVVERPIELSNLLVEIRKPSEIIGKSNNDAEGLEMINKLRIENQEPNWRCSDEENFQERIERAVKAVDMFLTRSEKDIIVVSHANFIRTMLTYMALGKNVTPAEYVTFMHFFHLSNTGISVCEYIINVFGEYCWRLRHWNDIAHLGD